MEKIIFILVLAGMLASCKEKEQKILVSDAPKPEVYQPRHQTAVVDINAPQKYVYILAPQNTPASSVNVKYDNKVPYARPVEIVYRYANGDTFKYILPAEFGLRANENGKLRVVMDDDCTVWLQGQTKTGKFREFVFYGNPKHNGFRIKPNSYTGEIKYRK